MGDEIKYNITPADFLSECGYQYKLSGFWLKIKVCPFCAGGDHGDKNTFVVHAESGLYSCTRSKCGEEGNFWNFIEKNGRDPKDYIDRDGGSRRRKKRKGFIYGRDKS